MINCNVEMTSIINLCMFKINSTVFCSIFINCYSGYIVFHYVHLRARKPDAGICMQKMEV